jgi:hypothetical protein
MPYYLVDFTRGVGFSNYRQLPVQPRRDLCATFSNVAGQERILYIVTGPQLVRFNAATMATENTGFFPVNLGTTNAWGWLHQDKNDAWFVGAIVNNTTMFAFNAQTGQYLTHTDTWGRQEPRLERDGRYVALVGGGGGPFQVWDLSTNTFGPVQTNGSNGIQYFSHFANPRGMWITVNNQLTAPFSEQRVTVSGGQFVQVPILANSALSGDTHGAGNWVQSDAELGGNLNRQWVYVDGNGTAAWSNLLAWNQALGVLRADGSDARLLAHHYSTNINYWDYPFVLPSPDGKVVIFNSNMLSSGRYDLFVAEVPLH